MSANEIANAVSTVEKYGLNPIAANQPLYNMFVREVERQIFPLSKQYGIGQVVYSPLAQGILTGKYRSVSELAPLSRAATKEGSQSVQSWLKEELLIKTRRLQMLSAEFGLSLTHLALSWTLRLPEVSSAIIGASRPEQIEVNAKASGIRLTNEQWDKVNSILAD